MVFADRIHLGQCSPSPGKPCSDMATESALDTCVHIVPSGVYLLHLHDLSMLTVVDP